MANLSLIRDLCDEKKISLKQLAEAVSISQNGLQRIIKDNSTKIDTLEKIAEYLDVPVTDFFRKDRNEIILVNEYVERINALEKEVASLSESLDDKKMILALLKKEGAVSGYNLVKPKEERGLDYNNLNDIDSILKNIDEQPFDYKDEDAKWKYIEDLVKANKMKKK